MKTKIITYKQFFKALRLLRKRGFVFCLYKSRQRIRSEEHDDGWVRSRSVWCKSYAGLSDVYYSPQQMIYREFFGGSTQKWICSTMATRCIGLSPKQAEELEKAQLELGRHSLVLRKRLLKACGLLDIPHSKRIRYTEKRHDGKRKCKA